MMRLLARSLPLALAAVSSAGVPRAAAAQGSRGIVISRVMADPSAVPDARGEWVEIANLGSASVDLRGWRLASGNDPGFVVPSALVVRAGARVVLARDVRPSTNGGVRADLAYTGITLGNAGDWVALRDPSGRTVDSLAWGRAPTGRAIERGLASPERTPEAPAPTPAPAPAPDSAPAPTTAPSPTPAAGDTASDRELVVRVLDVGQGDAILIQNGGSTVLVDGGPNPAALGAHLDALGLNGGTIDAVILTHQHADHYQGLRELFAFRRGMTVRFFWENQDASPNPTLARLRDSIAARVDAGSLVYRDTDDPCATGLAVCTISLRGGARLHIMRPDPSGRGANNRSPALKLVGPDSASFTMWMAGDAEHEALEWMYGPAGYADRPGMHADVLKADHHGSCNGVTDRYLDLVQPSLLVVSLGAVNDYGHMHEQAKTTYARHGIPWYRTDANGTITLRSPGTLNGGYTVTVERGTRNMSGPSDRRANQAACAGM